MLRNMYLGIDLGNKRCGIAIEVEGVVLPKGIIDRPRLITELKQIVEEYGIKVIVVGLPYDLYNNDLRQLNKTNIFIEKLKNIFSELQIDTIDERFTSFEADNVLDIIGVKNKEGQKDDISALLILESYLKRIK